MPKRTDRLNSLLKEVLADVIAKEVKDPRFHQLTAVTRVNITRDLRYAKVYVSVIGTEQERLDTISALNQAAGFVAISASKQVVMRYFPALQFVLDDSVDKHMRIEELLEEIHTEKSQRESDSE